MFWNERVEAIKRLWESHRSIESILLILAPWNVTRAEVKRVLS